MYKAMLKSMPKPKLIPMQKTLKWSAGIVVPLGLIIIFWLNLLEFTQITLAQERIRFMKTIEKEDLREGMLKAIYSGFKVDYCILKRDQDILIFKYTLGEHLNASLSEIETFFATTLKSQHKQPVFQCNLNAKRGLYETA